ncbi:YncE family protein [Rhodococcus sp. NPDC058521]|uniref:YncE family protein n=1 Tax=Rhodococcus sp. NPDC058521 TaxID=3346536 RepID=UPI0036644179
MVKPGNFFRPSRLGLIRRAAVAAVALTSISSAVAIAEPTPPAPGLREVLLVGNNWEGTADVIGSTAPYEKVGRISVIPDKEARMAEIFSNPVSAALFLGIRHTVGEGNDQLIDDLYTTRDGESIIASRPSFADVVSVDIESGDINWRFPVSGFRADHMAISRDGATVAVSASTSNTVHVVDTATGVERGQFATGDKPHENYYTSDGKYIWNMAIGEVNTPLDAPALDFTKGDRYITVADTTNFERVRTIDMRERLDAFGRNDLSDSVRPVAFTPDESKLYFQVSFFNGFVEYDIAQDRITQIKELPKNPETSPRRSDWINDSRHHGLSMSPDGSKLCVAGTMDDYATIVDRETLTEGPLVPASKPYWATVNGTGTDCVISESASDSVSAISFESGERVASIPVGDHPQRIRLGAVPTTWSGTNNN